MDVSCYVLRMLLCEGILLQLSVKFKSDFKVTFSNRCLLLTNLSMDGTSGGSLVHGKCRRYGTVWQPDQHRCHHEVPDDHSILW